MVVCRRESELCLPPSVISQLYSLAGCANTTVYVLSATRIAAVDGSLLSRLECVDISLDGNVCSIHFVKACDHPFITAPTVCCLCQSVTSVPLLRMAAARMTVAAAVAAMALTLLPMTPQRFRATR